MIKYILTLLLCTLSIPIWAYNYFYDDLKDEFNDIQFKKIFAHKGITACIWVQEYRGNQVMDGAIDEKTDTVMHNKCAAGDEYAGDVSSKSSRPIGIDPGHSGDAAYFSPPLKDRYKKLFPNWKKTMQQELADAKHYAKTHKYVCGTDLSTENMRNCELASEEKDAKSEGKKASSNKIISTISDTTKGIKSITGIFGKD